MEGLRRASLALVLGSAAAAFAPPLRAEPAGRLAYARSVGAEGCPDEERFRQAVAARLGEDPFAETARRSFRVEIVSEVGKLVGHVSLSDESGVTEGVRTFESAGDCSELVAAVALAVSLAINPSLEVSSAPSPAPTTISGVPEPARAGPPAAAERPPRAKPAVIEPAASPLELEAGLLGQVVVGAGPSPTLGAALAVRARLGLGSLSLEGRYDAPSSAPLEEGGLVKSSLLAALIAPCLHYRFFAGCALGLYGRVAASSEDAPEDGSDSGSYAAIGGRVAAELPVVAPLSVAVRSDVLGPLTPIHLVRNGTRSIWDSPTLSFALGIGVMVEIP